MGIKRPSVLPLLLVLEEGKWHDLELDLSTLNDDGTTLAKGKDWPCYFVQINGQEELEEVPFWAMTPFADWYDALSKKAQKQKDIEVQYRRTVDDDDLNAAEFR